MDDTKTAVLRCLNPHDGPFGCREIATAIGADMHKVRAALNALITEGKIVGEGNTRARRYSLVPST